MSPLKVNIKIALFCVATISFNHVHALDLTKVNLAYQYDSYDPFEFQYRVSQSDGQLHVYYTMKADSLAYYDQFFLVQKGYSSQSHDSLSNFTIDTLALSSKSGTFRLSFSVRQSDLLLITMGNQREGLYLVYDVPVASSGGFPAFVPVNRQGQPILENYITTDQVSISGPQNIYHVYRYEDDFDPADPAMGSMKPIAPHLEIDSAYFISDILPLPEPNHFFLIQSDTTDDNGVTLLRCPSYYPKFRKLEELIEPLTYITTPSEIKSLRSEKSRQAFEAFWLNIYGTKFRAKNAIRVYYDRIEQANRFFTDYKQGWKTDRGVMYIIFGPPEEVIRSDRNEIWRYQQGIEFEFIRISTLFTPSLYSLRRDKKYEELWYDQVGSIRKGL